MSDQSHEAQHAAGKKHNTEGHGSTQQQSGGLFSRFFGKSGHEEHQAVAAQGALPVRRINAPKYNNHAGKSPYPAFIKFKGVFDFEGLYKFMAGWLKERRYEFNETLYKYKPPELEVRWLAERKKTGFAKELIHVHFHGWGEWDVDVVKNGRKKRMANARIIIDLNMEIEAPYEDNFGQRRWNLPNERKILNFFHNYVLKREFDLMYDDVLYYEMYKFHTAIKDYLKLSTKGSAY